MNRHTLTGAVALTVCLATAAAPSPVPREDMGAPVAVQIMGGTFVMPPTVPEVQPVPPVEVVAAPPPPVPLAHVPVDLVGATRYALRQLPARDVLREVMGPRRFAHISTKITGESGWNCGVNNRSSSAAGLGQTLHNPSRVRLLASHWLGPFTWADVRGADCLADAVLIDALYDACGLGPWTPGWKCQRPLPR